MTQSNPDEIDLHDVTLFADTERLKQQLCFIVELDRLKAILRQTPVLGGARMENDAEHSWHLAIMAMVLMEHAKEPVDLLKVIKMVLLHDVVEIDAGDAFLYDVEAQKKKAELENKAADRLFGLLPQDQAVEFRAVWDEFEARETKEARFAAALDRLHPMLLNYLSAGGPWTKHGISKQAAVQRNSKIAEGSPSLWGVAEALLEDATQKGYLKNIGE